MSTRTITARFSRDGTLSDPTSVVVGSRDGTYGVKRADTGVNVVASGTALTRVSAGLYTLTFTEPVVGLAYDYVLQWVSGGETKWLKQRLTGSLTPSPLPPAPYYQMGIDTVACGDTVLSDFLTANANLVWAMQARRGVALDLHYQYYVLDLCGLAMDHVRMLIDTEVGNQQMTDTAYANASSLNDANSTTHRTRTSSFTENSDSTQDMLRSASRSGSSDMTATSSSHSERTASTSDTSSVTQSSEGSSSRSMSGTTDNNGALGPGGLIGSGTSTSHRGSQSVTVYTGSSSSRMTSHNIGLSGIGTVSWIDDGTPMGHATGYSSHGVAPSITGTLSGGNISDESSTLSHRRQWVGSQTSTGSSSFSSTGTRTNNRAGSSSMTASASSLMNGSATSASASHEEQHRTASSTSHSESAYSSVMAASATGHSESAGADAMALTGNVDRDYYSQIFESLKQIWNDTKLAIERLEKQMLMASRYLNQKMSTVTAKATLVGAYSLPTLPSLTQRPGIYNGDILGSYGIPADRYIVK